MSEKILFAEGAREVAPESQRECSYQRGGIVARVVPEDRAADDEEIRRIPVLQVRRNHTLPRLAAHDGAAGDMRRLVAGAVEGRLAGRPIFDAVSPVLPGFAAPAEFVF